MLYSIDIDNVRGVLSRIKGNTDSRNIRSSIISLSFLNIFFGLFLIPLIFAVKYILFIYMAIVLSVIVWGIIIAANSERSGKQFLLFSTLSTFLWSVFILPITMLFAFKFNGLLWTAVPVLYILTLVCTEALLRFSALRGYLKENQNRTGKIVVKFIIAAGIVILAARLGMITGDGKIAPFGLVIIFLFLSCSFGMAGVLNYFYYRLYDRFESRMDCITPQNNHYTGYNYQFNQAKIKGQIFLGMLISIIPILIVLSIFTYIQRKLFIPSEYVLIFRNATAIMTIILGFMAISISTVVIGKQIEIRGHTIRRSGVAAILTAVLFTILFFELFQYSYITPDGTFIKDNIFSEVRHYNWNSVSQADVTYGMGGKNKNEIYVIYSMLLDDGITVSLSRADHFFEKALMVDQLLRKNYINVNRKTLNRNEQAALKKKYSDQKLKNGENVYDAVITKIYNLK